MQDSVQVTIASWLMRSTSSFAIRHIPQTFAVIGTTRGRIRGENQDKAVAAVFSARDPHKNFRVFIVCDGLGGMQDGERCAAAGTSFFLADLCSTVAMVDRAQRLQHATEFANLEVCRMFHERGGTTLAAILITESGATAVAVGDTRIYRHGHKGELTQLTVDDTIAKRIAELTESADGSAAGGPFGHHLAQVIGQRGPVSPQIVDSHVLTNGDIERNAQSGRTGLLITTDGVHRMGAEIVGGLSRGASSARELVHRLISAADWMGGADNATALYVSFHEAANRTTVGRTEPLGLQLHDAHGELQLVPIDIDTGVERSPSREIPARPPTPESKPTFEKRKRGSKNKRKGKRAQTRHPKGAKKNKNPTQPELDIKVTQHSE